MNLTEKLTAEKMAVALKSAEALMRMHKAGALGGETMPEDANPGLPKDADENYLFFTLPMALNYQRDAYRLWESANKTYADDETADVFYPNAVVRMGNEDLREKLLRHKVAMQPNRHPETWMRLCHTFLDFNGSVKEFLGTNDYSIEKIKAYMIANKKAFPYLSGAKIMNYWLYIIEQYTDAVFTGRDNITVGPDTHIIKASAKLGLIEPGDMDKSDIRETVADLWKAVFSGTQWDPIDIHTPLWLWSRSGFAAELDK